MTKDNPPPYTAMGAPPAPGFAPQQQGYAPPPQVGVTEQRTVLITHLPLGDRPVAMRCPHCNSEILTDVRTEANTKTHLFALLLCVVGCWPCCLVPYCMDSCQSRIHSCPNCKGHLGNFSD